MSLLLEIELGNCSHVFMYLSKKINILNKNRNNTAQILEIRNDLANDDNRQQILSCALTSKRITSLYSVLYSYIK